MRTPLVRPRSSVSLLLLLGQCVLWLCNMVIWLALAALVCGIMLYRLYGQDLPDPLALAKHRPFETTRIFARDGTTVLHELFDDGQRTVIPFSDVPWAVRAATVAVEDADFLSNPGVDLRGIVRALYLNRSGQIVSGGSTITQQLVRNVLFSAEERSEQSYRRKIREAILAFRLSKQLSKEQILGLYLNEIYYGNMAYGVEAAAQSYFGKSARDLSLAEAALLAGLPQAPTELNPFQDPEAAKDRQRIVLELMAKQGYLSPEQAATALAEPLTLKRQTTTIRHPHWVFYIRDLLEQRFGHELVSRGGLRVVTSLDPVLQGMAEDAAREQIEELRARNATNASVVIIDPQSNEIRAMVGSVDFNDPEIDGQVNVALQPRQPGSSLKPLVYAQALADGWTPATIIWDTPTDFGGGYRPQNYDNTFHGPQRLRIALAGSLNIPAVKTLQHIGLDRFLDLMERLGITTLKERERYGLAVALGAGEVKLLELTGAYSTLANSGNARPTVALLRVTTSHGEVLLNHTPEPGTQVFGRYGSQVAYQIADILSDNAARAPIFGPDSVLRLPDDRPAAVKTGTSNEYRDSWAVGWTPDLVAGVWVGNSDNSSMDQIAGANGAGKIWNAIMQRAHEGKPPLPFARPPELETVTICPATGLPGDDCAGVVPEHFIAGAVPQSADGLYTTVTVGGDGSCLATDLTPPEQRQRRTFLRVPPEAASWNQATVARPPTVACAPPGTTATATTAGPTMEVAAFVVPQPGALLSGTVRVIGSAAGEYMLEYGAGSEPSEWTPITSGLGGASNSLLGQWDTSALPAGLYTLRLLVTLPGNPQQEARSTVEIAHDALTVRLVEPLPDTVMPQSTSLTLRAEISGAATRVEFLVDEQLVGTSQGAQPSITWTALAPGRHTIMAVAIDAGNERVQSQPIVVRVE